MNNIYNRQLLYTSWDSYNEMVHDLYQKIVGSNIRYNMILAIPRGGLILSVHLSNLLNIPMLVFDKSIKQKVYSNCLVVDDIADSGSTLDKVSRIFNKDIYYDFCTLFVRYKTTKIMPRFYSRDAEDYWIVFPWEYDKNNVV